MTFYEACALVGIGTMVIVFVLAVVAVVYVLTWLVQALRPKPTQAPSSTRRRVDPRLWEQDEPYPECFEDEEDDL